MHPTSLPIPGFPFYLISSDGSVYSERRRRNLRPGVDRLGYHRQPLRRRDGKVVCCYVHRLVAQAFVPLVPGCDDVDHIDGNPRNNHVSNLRWLSHRENILAAITRRGAHWGAGVSRPESFAAVVAFDSDVQAPFPNIKRAVEWLSAQQVAAGGLPMTYRNAAPNISNACRSGRTAYGWNWRYA